MTKIVEIQFHDTNETIQATVEAASKRAAEAIVIRKLATAPGDRTASYTIGGNATKAQRATLPTIDQAIA